MAAALAGRTGDDEDEGSSDDTTDSSDETAATVRVTESETYGEILTGPDGKTLYLLESDDQGAGTSACPGSCAETWPPLTAGGDTIGSGSVEAEVDSFEREDGETQVTANGLAAVLLQ